MSHQFLQHIQFRPRSQGNFRLPPGGVHSLDLDGVQGKYSVVFQEDPGHRVQHSRAGPLSLAVMFLLIAHIGALSYMEGMDPVMAALVASAVVDAAASHDGHIRALRDIEVVVDDIGHTGGIYHHRDVHLLSPGGSVNIYVDPVLVLFLPDLHVLAVSVAEGDPVIPEIEGAFLLKTGAVDLLQDLFGNLI